MLDDLFPPQLLPDRRSRRRRELDAEGRWSLPTEVVLERFEAVLTG